MSAAWHLGSCHGSDLLGLLHDELELLLLLVLKSGLLLLDQEGIESGKLLVLSLQGTPIAGTCYVGHISLWESGALGGGDLCRDLLILDQTLQHFEALVFLLGLEAVADVEDLLFDFGVSAVVDNETWREGLELTRQKFESIWVGDLKSVGCVDGQLLVGLAKLLFSVGIGAVLSKVAWLALLKELADLCLVVVVWDVQHFHLNLNWQRLSQESALE